jgi:hypothetical protein
VDRYDARAGCAVIPVELRRASRYADCMARTAYGALARACVPRDEIEATTARLSDAHFPHLECARQLVSKQGELNRPERAPTAEAKY